jgi:predicted O-methyltransferase YrrM
MKFDIAVVNHGTDFHLLNLLSSVRAVLPPGSFGMCHVWDNASTDASRAVLEELGRDVPWLCAHLSPVNVHHGPALDALLSEKCGAEWVLVLDSDTRLLGDFRAALPRWSGQAPAFIGQVHPDPNQLYAYLCHLLVHRPTYLGLPPFHRDGAPGLAFFAAVEARGLPWERFRFRDWVEHHGQGTLGRILARGERSNELYAFAAAESERNPAWKSTRERERELEKRLSTFLADRGRYLESWPTPDEHTPDEPAPPRRAAARAARSSRSGARLGERLGAAVPTALLVREARRIGLPHTRAEIDALLRPVRRRRPRTILEIGTARGGTLFLLSRLAAADATVVSAGLPPWELDDPGEEPRRRMLEGFARRRQRLHVVRRDALAPETQGAVRALLQRRPLDILFVTNERSAARREACLAAFSPLVKPGGLVAWDEPAPGRGRVVRRRTV